MPPTPIHNWLSPSHRPTVAIFDRRAYLYTGWERGRVWSGYESFDYPVGITPPTEFDPTVAPVTAGVPGGGATFGIHSVKVRYLDGVTEQYSASELPNPIDVTDSINVDGSWTWTLGVGAGQIPVSPDGRVTHVLLEVTATGGAIFYEASRVANVAGNTLVYNQTDTVLTQADIHSRVKGTTEFPAYPPPLFRHGIAFRRRMFGAGSVIHTDGLVNVTQGSAVVTATGGAGTNWDPEIPLNGNWYFNAGAEHKILSIDSSSQLTLTTAWTLPTANNQGYRVYNRDNLLYWSEPNMPEVFDGGNSITALDDQTVVGLAAFSADILIFGLTGFERFTYNLSPLDGIKRQVPGERGALSHWSIIEVDNAVYVMDRQGMYVYTGDTPVHLSRSIDRYLERHLDYAQRDKFFAVFYPRTRTIRWYVVVQGQGEPHWYVEYDLERKVWGLGKLDVAMTAGETARRTFGLQPYMGDENGFSWVDDIGPGAGLGFDTVGRVTALAGASALNVGLAPPGLNVADNLQGVMVRTEDGRTAVVESNVSNSLTLITPGFTQPPVAGEELLVGRVVSALKTRAFYMDERFVTRKRGVYLHLHFEPQTEGEFRVRFFRDLTPTPITSYPAIAAAAGRLLEEGVEAPLDGESDFVVSLSKGDGVVKIPVGSDPFRVIQVELEVREPRSKLILYGFELSAAGGKEVRA